MDTTAMQLTLYGALTALMSNPAYFYKSDIPRYSQWTDLGKEAFNDLILALTPAIVESEYTEAKQKSQDMVLDALRNNYDEKT